MKACKRGECGKWLLLGNVGNVVDDADHDKELNVLIKGCSLLVRPQVVTTWLSVFVSKPLTMERSRVLSISCKHFFHMCFFSFSLFSCAYALKGINFENCADGNDTGIFFKKYCKTHIFQTNHKRTMNKHTISEMSMNLAQQPIKVTRCHYHSCIQLKECFQPKEFFQPKEYLQPKECLQTKESLQPKEWMSSTQGSTPTQGMSSTRGKSSTQGIPSTQRMSLT